jgi:hypothetical protein
MKIEILLGNWGMVTCTSKEDENYMRAAHELKEVYQATQSWQSPPNTWLYPTMEAEYLAACAAAKKKCEELWELIPDKENLRKMHTGY